MSLERPRRAGGPARPRAFVTLAALAGLTASLTAAAGACSSSPDREPFVIAPSARPPVEVVPVSAKARVNFKGGRRYAEDLSRALALPRAELCRELSGFDCVDEVHNFTLGGVAPYEKTIYRPTRERTVSTANAIDRIALTACTERARRDFAAPEGAALFGELARPVGVGVGAGAGPDLGALTTRLYTRLLGRTPNEAEAAALASFHAELASELGPAAPERFAALACYAVATSEEALFY